MSIEAMKLALEALQKIYIAPEHEEYIRVWWPACKQAITALRAAIEQAELVQPVAWRTFDGEGGYDYRSYEDNENYRDEYIKRNGGKYAQWVEPLYTAPPQRQPLTDEALFELAEIAWRHGWASCRDAEYVGEEAEDQRWGEVGAEVVQDIAAHGITGEKK